MSDFETQRAHLSPQKQAEFDMLRAKILKETAKERAVATSRAKIQLASLETNTGLASRPKIVPYFPGAKKHPEFDSKPDYFNQNFSYSSEKLAPGVLIKHDVGIDFYVVQSGDTIFKIRKKLVKIKKYEYLDRPEYQEKMRGFNIDPKKLIPGLLIPIPLESRDRQISDKQFVNYCQQAIAEMKTDKIYGAKLQELLQKFSEKKLIELMLAVAKQESGGKPLGQFEFHRWEPAKHIRAFSFSIFHVVMKIGWPGLKARKNINITEGQSYHPQNAAKLFLAFLFEKAKETKGSLADFLPIQQLGGPRVIEGKFNRFANFYNGSGWREFNPDYVQNIKKYLHRARILMSKANKVKVREPTIAQTGQQLKRGAENIKVNYEQIGKTTIFRKILNWPGLDINEHTALKLAKKIIGKVDTYYAKDQLSVWEQGGIFYARLKRDNKVWEFTYQATPSKS